MAALQAQHGSHSGCYRERAPGLSGWAVSRPGGQLTLFRERLGSEVRAQTGEGFAIFQDRNDIAWGQNWQQRINEALDAVTLLLVVITPGLLRSPACREEIGRFLDRERELGRGPDLAGVLHLRAGDG
jgi:F-box protein 11